MGWGTKNLAFPEELVPEESDQQAGGRRGKYIPSSFQGNFFFRTSSSQITSTLNDHPKLISVLGGHLQVYFFLFFFSGTRQGVLTKHSQLWLLQCQKRV